MCLFKASTTNSIPMMSNGPLPLPHSMPPNSDRSLSYPSPETETIARLSPSWTTQSLGYPPSQLVGINLFLGGGWGRTKTKDAFFTCNCGLFSYGSSFLLTGSQMTTKFLTIKFANFPNFIVMEFPRKTSVFEQFSVKFPPPQPPPKRKFF